MNGRIIKFIGRPKMRNSVLKGLRDMKLDDIQLATLVIVFSRSVSYERDPEQRMIREVEYYQHRVGGLLKN